MNIAFVSAPSDWENIEGLARTFPVCSVMGWRAVLDCDIIGWPHAEYKFKPQWAKYDIFIVNHFGIDNHSVRNLKRDNPDAKVLALIDPSIDVVLSLTDHFSEMYTDLKHADAIGGRTKYDAMIYQNLLGVKAFWVPSPIGRYDDFAQYRLPFSQREHYLVTTGHPFAPNMSGHNLAFAKLMVDLFGYDIHYVMAENDTKTLAKLVGTNKITFHGRLPYRQMLDLVSKCAFGFDLYSRHSQGRNAQTFAMAKTPLIGSTLTNQVGGIAVDPFDLDEAATWALKLQMPDVWATEASKALFYTEMNYGFAASLRRMQFIIRWLLTGDMN